MLVYKYDENNNYMGVVQVQKNPRALGEYLMPRNTTTVKPPEPSEYSADKAPAFNADLEQWYLVESPKKKLEDSLKLEQTNNLGVRMYELDSLGKVVPRDNSIVEQENTDLENKYHTQVLKDSMDSKIINKALEITRASSTVSASAFFQAYTLRAAQASEYINEGLEVHFAIEGFVLGDALDTIEKIVTYYNSLNVLMDKYRNSEINNYLLAKAQL